MHARTLGWLPTDCTAELRPTIYVHSYASIQRETPRTHWFSFVNINSLFWGQELKRSHVFTFGKDGKRKTPMPGAGGPLLSSLC